MAKSQSEYSRKRDFKITPEPSDEEDTRRSGRKRSTDRLQFVIQKHHARQLHYDFRLELDGTLKSWAVPKGPSLDPSVKRLAVHVEDHPLSYADFEGDIPEGQYGAGHVIVWDTGTWQAEGDPEQAYKKGKLKFSLEGKKLSGTWNLIRTHFRDSDKDGAKKSSKEHWLLIKEDDEYAKAEEQYDVLQEEPDSVLQDAVPDQAPPGDFPDTLKPQLATLATKPPSHGKWVYEIKLDGYRIMTRMQKGQVRLYSRSGLDWTGLLPELAKAIASLKLKDSWLDGEIVVIGKNGLPDFQALQNAMDAGSSHAVEYFLFDTPWFNGQDLRDAPLSKRRELLENCLDQNPHPLLKFSDGYDGDQFESLYQSACKMSLEGLIGKLANSPYRSGRSRDWVKLKCRPRQEFVIVGFTEPEGSRSCFGALLLAVYSEADQGELIYCGKVGTGFTDADLKAVYQHLKPSIRKTSPFAERPTSLDYKKVHWLKPVNVCEVEFAQWTRDHVIRHAVFLGLRRDKQAEKVVREDAMTDKNPVAGVKISSPERIIDTKTGTRKLELAAFYESISDWILPHLKSRPVSLLRAPEGVGGETFFQKHAEHLSIPNIKHLDPALDPGHESLLEIDSIGALIGTVQMGTIELHTWGATTDKIETPDRIILDLDPDPDLPWKKMIEATQLLSSVLSELSLEHFLKTSGGKGLHVVIPLARYHDWDTVKQFAKSISEFMAEQLPDRFVAKMGPKNRINKIFIDYLRNSRGASTVCAYSVRARPGLPVSVPITHAELETLKSADQWNSGNLYQRLESLSADPWEGYVNKQRITQKMIKTLS